ncbi:MAG: tetratricopeptide repeat protein, partial [Wenzhouxiangellaceae bacterium]
SDRALELTGEALEILQQRPGEATERIADVLAIRGQALRGLGQWERAVDALREAQALARVAAGDGGSRLLARTANNLGTTLFYAGRIDEAIPAMEYALRQWRDLGLADTSDALTVMTNLASLSQRQGDLDQAERLYQEAIERRERRFGASGALGAAYLNFGSLLALRYRIDESRQSVLRGIDLITRFEGEATISHARGVLALGRVLMTAGDWERAGEQINRAAEMFSALVGEQHLYTEISRLQQARLLARSEPIRARARIGRVIEALREMQPASDAYLADAWCALARLEIDQGQGQAALQAAGQCAELRRERFPDDSWMRAEARAIEAAARVLLGQTQAREQLRDARTAMARSLGEGHPDLRWCDRQLNG